MSWKGRFKPKNPKKYAGDPNNIIYRSQIELRFMLWLDSHKEVLQWASEEFHIPYFDPVTNKTRRYFPDFIFKTKTESVIVEIKCFMEAVQPVLTESKTKRRYMKEICTWTTNNAKWAAATKFAKDRKMQFRIITEKQLGLNYGS